MIYVCSEVCHCFGLTALQFPSLSEDPLFLHLPRDTEQPCPGWEGGGTCRGADGTRRAKEPGALSNSSASGACPSQTVSVCPAPFALSLCTPAWLLETRAMCAHGCSCWERPTATLDWAEAGLVTAGHGDALSVGRCLSAHVGTHSSFHSKVGKSVCLGNRMEKRGLRGTVENEGVVIL